LQSSVRLALFSLALSHSFLKGVPATWLVFIPYASAIGTYWASLLYCITVTVLEVVFSIGASLLLTLSFSQLDSQLARHDMEDEPVPHAPLVLYRTDRDHRSMLPHSHGRMRMLYLGILSDRLQAIPFHTSIGVVGIFLTVIVKRES
jgi:hypothetical protein